ncbi:choice-of-anchor P family protein [Actinomadura gamaensis]|uniref:Choice-of-anchor P family protein n=1 Tax=Actinomadura gamaensis TaxID=1763541 RepID=A0ABV9U8C1_9ACTN
MRYGTATKRLTRAVTLAAVGGLLAASPALAATRHAPRGAAGAAGREGTAFGLALNGPIPLAPKPAVASKSGMRHTALLDEEHTKFLKAAVLDVAASPTQSQASVTKLRVTEVGLAADAVRAHCSGGTGSTELVDAMVGGKRLPVSPPPNTTIPVDLPQMGRVALILNKQERVPNGVRVTAIELTTPLGKLGTEDVRVSSATCMPGVNAPSGKGADKVPNGDGGGEAPSGKGAAEAPRPKPVRHDLAVTG